MNREEIEILSNMKADCTVSIVKLYLYYEQLLENKQKQIFDLEDEVQRLTESNQYAGEAIKKGV